MKEFEIANIKGLSALEIQKRVKSGAEFVFFRYSLSFILASVDGLSRVYLVQDESEFKKLKMRYNFFSLLMGPWSIWGPFNTYNALKTNKLGVNVTKDILLNLDTYNPISGKILINQVHSVFIYLSKPDFKEAQLAFLDYFNQSLKVNEVYIGKYINVEGGDYPYFVGIDTPLNKSEFIDKLEKLFYERFYTIAQLVVFTKEEDEELFDKIKEQGQRILNRPKVK